MNNRTRAMPLDSGTSADAAGLLPSTDREKVRATITAILAECGPLTDDELVDRYTARAGAHPSVPRVTPQRIRTARAHLVRDGQVREAEMMAFSALGNRASAWTLA